jgi:hypothetical protein
MGRADAGSSSVSDLFSSTDLFSHNSSRGPAEPRTAMHGAAIPAAARPSGRRSARRSSSHIQKGRWIMPRTSKPSFPSQQVAPKQAAAAFALVQPELATILPEEIPRITIDVGRAVSVALGALPHLRTLRAAMETELPKHPIILLDKLETYALAAWYAHILVIPPDGDDTPVKKLLKEATTLRESLLIAAEALAHRGLVDVKRVAEIRSGQGYFDLASDLVALAALFVGSWEELNTKTAIELRDVQRAAELGPELLAALGERGQPLSAPKAAGTADQRLRAFALFVRAYDACQRAVAYLRWKEGDADTIAPSLFKGRGRRRSSEPKADGTTGMKTEPVPASPQQTAPASPL